MIARLIARRAINLVITLFLISLIVFAVTQLLPGDVAQMILGPYATPDNLAVLRTRLGLDRPAMAQYLEWLSGFLVGDWGPSFTMNRPTRDLLLPPLSRSLELAGLALLGVVVVGIPLGILAGLKENSVVDHLISVVSYSGISVPAFVAGSLFILLFAGLLRVLPGSGYVPISRGLWPWLRHLILPAATTMLMLLDYVIRMTRVGVVEVMKSKYIRTARLKGLPLAYIIRRHVLRNALLPTVTVLAMNMGWLVGSMVIVEMVFAYPGIGRAIVSAITTRDLPVVQAGVLLLALITCLSTLAADVAYAFLNPKIRYT